MPMTRSLLWGAAILAFALLITADVLPAWMTFAVIGVLPLLAVRRRCGPGRSDLA